MTNVINPAGWHVWDATTPTSGVQFGENGNTGAGASGTRVSFSQKLSGPVSITTILGNGYTSAGYYDASYM